MARPPGPARVVTVVVVLAAILADPAGSVLAAGRPAEERLELLVAWYIRALVDNDTFRGLLNLPVALG